MTIDKYKNNIKRVYHIVETKRGSAGVFFYKVYYDGLFRKIWIGDLYGTIDQSMTAIEDDWRNLLWNRLVSEEVVKTVVKET